MREIILDGRTNEAVTYITVTTGYDGTVITEANEATYITEMSPIYRKKFDGTYVKRVLPNGWINVEWFGLKGDGIFDNYFVLRNLAAACSNLKNVKLFFPTGRYLIDQYRISNASPNGNNIFDIEWFNIDGLEIDFRESVIDIKGDFNRTADYTITNTFSWTSQLTVFRFWDCKNIKIYNGEIYGNVDKMIRGAGVVESSGTALDFKGCEDVEVINVFTHHMSTDGIVVTGSNKLSTLRKASKRVFLKNVKSKNNARQGMSIGNAYWVVVEDGEFSETGFYEGDYTPHNPRAGIDIEPGYYGVGTTLDVLTSHIFIRRCKFTNNRGNEIVTSSYHTVNFVEVDDCDFENIGELGDIGTNRVNFGIQKFIIKNCRFTNVGLYISFALSPEASKMVFEVYNNKFYCYKPDVYPLYNKVPEIDARNGAHGEIYGNKIYFLSETPFTQSYSIDLDSKNINLFNNEIFVSHTSHEKNGNLDHIARIQCGSSINNVWKSDIESPYFFYIAYGTGLTVDPPIVDDTFKGRIASYTGYSFQERVLINDSSATSKLVIGNGLLSTPGTSRSIVYGTEIPTTGTYKKGDIVFNREANDSSPLGWQCVTDGEPGEWKEIGSNEDNRYARDIEFKTLAPYIFKSPENMIINSIDTEPGQTATITGYTIGEQINKYETFTITVDVIGMVTVRGTIISN